MDDMTVHTIGKRIHELREAQGLSEARLSIMAGISRPYLSRIERGLGNPTVTVLGNIAAALGMTLSELVEGL